MIKSLQITEYSPENKNKFYVFCEKMWIQLGRPWDPTEYQKDLLDITKNYQTNGGNFWLAWYKGSIVGCSGLKALNINDSEFVRFYVLSEYRGRKIGAGLIHTAIHYSLENNFKRFLIDTDSKKSTRAIEIFKNIGFVEIKPYKNTPFSDFFMNLNLQKFKCEFCNL